MFEMPVRGTYYRPSRSVVRVAFLPPVVPKSIEVSLPNDLNQ
jgi:hypothetical protein